MQKSDRKLNSRRKKRGQKWQKRGLCKLYTVAQTVTCHKTGYFREVFNKKQCGGNTVGKDEYVPEGITAGMATYTAEADGGIQHSCK